MEHNWIYIEPYSFFFVKENIGLFYNTLNFKLTKIEFSEHIKSVVLELAEQNCIKIPYELKNNTELELLISKLQSSYNGDIIYNHPETNRPAIFKSIINNQREFQRLQKLGDVNMNQQLVDYLDGICIYVNGFVNDVFHKIYDQTPSYLNSTDVLDIVSLQQFLTPISSTKIEYVSLLGGDVFNYAELSALINIIKTKAHYIYIYLLYTCFEESHILEYMGLISEIKIIVPSFCYDKVKFELVLNKIQNLSIKYQLCFLVSNENDLDEVEILVDTLDITDYVIIPIYDKNISFFKTHVFLNHNDINSIGVSKTDIYTNMTMNKNNFGQLTIFPDGSVYANVCKNRLGNIKENELTSILSSELSTKNSWLNTREQMPCCECIYQWLCPPPSNYESVIGKPNLCHIKP